MFRWIEKIYRLGVRFPFLVMSLALVATVLSFYGAAKLAVETDFSRLLPASTPSVQNMNQLKKYFGNEGHLYVTVEAGDAKLAEEYADRLVEQAEKLPSIRYVEYRRPVDFFQDRKWIYLDLEDLEKMEARIDRSLVLQKKGVSPVFSGVMDFADEEDRPDLTFEDIREKYKKKLEQETGSILSGDEGKFIIIRVKAYKGTEDFEANRALIASVKEIEKRISQQKPEYRDIKVGYAGTYMTSIEGVDLVKREMGTISAVVSLILLLIMVIYFRSFSGAVLVGLPLLMSVLWTGGLIYFLLGRVNLLTAFGASILAGLGSDYGIYLLARYAKERENGADFQTACRLTFGKTGTATLMAMLTTIGAFGALTLSDFIVFKEFGIVGALGLFLNYIAMILLMPALLTIGERFPNNGFVKFFVGLKQKKKQSYFWRGAWMDLIFNTKGARAWIFGTLLLIGFCAFTIPAQSRIVYEEGQMEFQNIPSNKLYERISKVVDVSLHPTVLFVRGDEMEAKTVNSLDAQLKDRPKEANVFERVVGMTSFLPPEQGKKREILERMVEKYPHNRFVNERQKEEFVNSVKTTLATAAVTRQGLPPEIRRMFIAQNDPSIYAVYVFPSINRSSTETLERYNKGILKAKAESGSDFTPVDASFIHYDIVNLISSEISRGLAMVLLFLSIVLLITLRNVKRSLLILFNLVGALILLSGSLYVLGIRLNIMNIAVFPIILGTGIDCFIHLSEHYNESGDLRGVMRTEIPAILVSNLTSIIGFGSLLFTSSLGLRSMGWVSVIGLTIMSLLCVLVFPRMLSLPSLGKIEVLKVEEKPA